MNKIHILKFFYQINILKKENQLEINTLQISNVLKAYKKFY
jgi:hypothetical protein